MNYLAHTYLGEQCSQGYVGAMFGDFVKGNPDPQLPAIVARGIRLHRRIDRFTDQHPCHLRSRNRFVAPRRRFAGIIVDIVYDHFLCAKWYRFSATPLPEFTGRVYQSLYEYAGELPGRLAIILPRMAQRDWLAGYGDIDRLERTLDGVASRVRRGEAMAGAIAEVKVNYAGLEADFEAFFPDLVGFTAHWKARYVNGA